MSKKAEDNSSFERVKKTLLAFPAHLAEGYTQGKSLPLPSEHQNVQKILFCGVGGSGIGGQIAKQIVQHRLPISFEIISVPPLPGFVDQKTLVILSSYSGNTKETLGVAQMAKKQNLPVVVLSSDGELCTIFSGKPIFTLPKGLQPRCALGSILGNLLGFLENLFPILEFKRELEEALLFLQDTLLNYGTREESTIPYHLAGLLEGKLPVIYGVQNLTHTAAYRFKTQLNENAKQMALYGVVPEIMHNEIVGLSHPEGIPWIFLLLRDREEPPLLQTMIKVFLRHLKSRQWPVEEIFSQGRSLLTRVLSLVVLADWTSLFLARRNQENPMSIPPIRHLKRILQYFECKLEEDTL
ncbi:MAG: SIS domain-containing protein [Candidatus Caldatribacteriaceae bacterium]